MGSTGKEGEELEEYPPKELVARVDVTEEWPEKENNSDSDSEDSEDEGIAKSPMTRSRGQHKPIQLLLTP